MNGGRAVGAVVGLAVILAGLFGVPVLPHQWFGLTAAELVGLGMLAFIPAVIVTLLLVIMLLLRQLKDGQAWMAWRMGLGPAPQHRRSNVIRGPWRKSG